MSFHQPLTLCDECLVGRTVPIYRPQVHEWQVGEIDEYDRKTGMHHFIFPDSEVEWLKVDPTPFNSYLNHHKSIHKLTSHHMSCQGEEPNQFLELPRIDKRDDVSAFDQGFEPRDHLDERNNYAAPWRFGRGRKHTTEQVESKPVPDSIWVEQPPRIHYHHQDAISFQTVASRHWTWPSFGLGGTPRVHPGQAVVMTSGSMMRNNYDPNHRTDIANEYPNMNRNSQMIVEPPRKSYPRFWTVEEDNMLLAAVESKGGGSGQESVKWPQVAKCIPGRTGKQCRERYLNHLKPRVKLNRWSAAEDSVAFYLFQSIGSKWAMISKCIPGRTDNGVKNRVHFLKRRLDQHVAHVVTAAGNDHGDDSLGNSTNSKMDNDGGNDMTLYLENSKSEEQGEISRKLSLLLSRMMEHRSVMQGDFRSIMSEYSFGPFRSLDRVAPESCLRCHLMMPSAQTGQSVCETSGWCIMCTKLPPYLSGYVLGKFLSRSCQEGRNILDESRFV